MAKYPIFLELRDRQTVVIGGGRVALRKAEVLLKAGARLRVVAPEVCACLQDLSQKNNIDLIESGYTKDRLDAAWLVIAATDDRALNEQIYQDCQDLRIICNVVDQPDLCDFFVPAIAQRGALQIAIGTDGHCPAYAGHLRRKFEKLFTEKHAEFLGLLQQMRTRLIQEVADPGQRKALMCRMADDPSFDLFVKEGAERWLQHVRTMITTPADPRES